MSHRERAEALGWFYCHGSTGPCSMGPGWWATLRVGQEHRPTTVEVTFGCWFRGVKWPTEDEALAHALLLRDVVLS